MPRRSLFSSDVPFSPKKMPIHYGWIIAAVAIFGFWASIPGHSMGVNVFTEKLITALNLSRTEISATFFVGFLRILVTCVVMGLVSWIGYSFNIFQLHWWLVPFLRCPQC